MANVLACLLTRSSVTPADRFQYPAFSFETGDFRLRDNFHIG
jgi:hypothetical protein